MSFRRKKFLKAQTYHSIGGDAMLQAVELPAGVTHLDTSLTDMNRNNFSHFFSSFFLKLTLYDKPGKGKKVEWGKGSGAPGFIRERGESDKNSHM